MYKSFGSHVTLPAASQDFPRSWSKEPSVRCPGSMKANFKWDFQVREVYLYALDPLFPFSYARAPLCSYCIHAHDPHPGSAKLNFSGLFHPARTPGDFLSCRDQSFNLYGLNPRDIKSLHMESVPGAQEGLVVAQTRKGSWSDVAGEGLLNAWSQKEAIKSQGNMQGSLELLRWPGICSHAYFELESNLNEWGIFFFFKKIFEGIKSCATEPTLWKGTIITLNCNAIHAFRGISWCVHTAFLCQKNIVKQIKKISPVASPFWNNFLKAQCKSILYLHVLKCLSPHKLTNWVPSRLYPTQLSV